MTWHRLGAIVAAMATFGGSWAMGMAVAEPPEPRLVLTDVGSSAVTPITIDGMYPGLAVTRPYAVSMTSTAPDARLAIELGNLTDLERGCNRAETNSSDLTCGELDGELSQQLLFSARLTAADSCEDPTGASQVVPATPLTDLADAGVIQLDAIVTSGDERCLLLTFDLPWAADNLVQTDLVRFDLTVHAEQALPDQAVAGEQEGPDDGQQVLGATDRRGQLPRAGLAVAGLLALGAGAVTTGGWLVRTTRRRGRG